MKAAVYRRYGPPDVVQVEDVPTPTAKANEVLVRVHASTVSSGDTRIRGLRMPAGFGPLARPIFGVFGPRQPILGTELAGVVVALGASVTRFQVGDAVFAFPGIGMRCHAEYRAVAADGCIDRIPTGFTMAEAAALCFGGTIALYALRDAAAVQPGERVLVIGASGTVGSAAVQLAKHLGAHVTGVASAANVDLVRGLGADAVIDYRATSPFSAGETYDVIVDAVGAVDYESARASLSQRGRLLLLVANLGQLITTGFVARGSTHRVIAGSAPERPDDVRTLRALAEAGHFKPLIDSCVPLADIAAAHARVDSGRKRGSVVVMMEQAAA